MNGARAKLIRAAAKEIAGRSGQQSETQYDGMYNSRRTFHGTIRLSHCERAIGKQIKSQVVPITKNLPRDTFVNLIIAAIE